MNPHPQTLGITIAFPSFPLSPVHRGEGQGEGRHSNSQIRPTSPNTQSFLRVFLRALRVFAVKSAFQIVHHRNIVSHS